ncbi:MAG: phospholipase D family protein [Syntrophorhabdales bacterium]|jgi:phosphatidylserine/phosphatidylglycerophosphate/cardiolipin synthase-like enzyme
MGGYAVKKSLIAFAVLIALSVPAIGHPVDPTLRDVPASVYFSPDGGATQAIMREIDHATLEVRVQAYSFTSAPIAKALVDAHKRGVSVEVILDKSQRTEKYSGATFLANNRIPVYIDSAHTIAHNKIMIIDGQTVVTGSFNFTKAAEERSAENLLVIRSKELAKIYMGNWERHREHSSLRPVFSYPPFFLNPAWPRSPGPRRNTIAGTGTGGGCWSGAQAISRLAGSV